MAERHDWSSRIISPNLPTSLHLYHQQFDPTTRVLITNHQQPCRLLSRSPDISREPRPNGAWYHSWNKNLTEGGTTTTMRKPQAVGSHRSDISKAMATKRSHLARGRNSKNTTTYAPILSSEARRARVCSASVGIIRPQITFGLSDLRPGGPNRLRTIIARVSQLALVPSSHR